MRLKRKTHKKFTRRCYLSKSIAVFIAGIAFELLAIPTQFFFS